SPTPLIGVRMNDTDSTVLFGLSYTHDKKWLAIPEGADDAEDFVEWKPNRTYQVVLRMNTEYWTVFVNRDEIRQKRYDDHLFDSHRISHFYIGGSSKGKIATGGHVTVTNVMLYNEELWRNDDLYKLKTRKVTIPSPGVEEQSTEQVTGTGLSVASESLSEESASHEELTEDDTDEQEEESVHTLVPAASSSTVAAESSVPESATATESAEASRSEDNAQFHQGETA
ncbi:trans-sialidase, putative, partial [Trypanosoma cruzi]